MRRIKAKNIEKESPIIDNSPGILPEESPINEAADVHSIEEFIEIKKLQNRLLKKMLNDINQLDKNDKFNK